MTLPPSNEPGTLHKLFDDGYEQGARDAREITDEMVERATEAWRQHFLYSDDSAGVRAALEAAFSTKEKP